MDACPHALYHHLATDLERWLPTLSGRILFDSNVEKVPWPGVTPSEVSCLWLLNSLLKKFEDEKAKDADNKALQKFLASNDRCRDFCDDASTHDELSAIIHASLISVSTTLSSPSQTRAGGSTWISSSTT